MQHRFLFFLILCLAAPVAGCPTSGDDDDSAGDDDDATGDDDDATGDDDDATGDDDDATGDDDDSAGDDDDSAGDDDDATGADADGDGYDDTVDCDDANPAVHPAAWEVCDDGIDNDCDGLIDAEELGASYLELGAGAAVWTNASGFPLGADWTIEMWLRPNNGATNMGRRLLGLHTQDGDPNPNPAYVSLTMDTISGGDAVTVGGRGGNGVNWAATGGETAPNTDWRHLAWVFDGTLEVLTWYVDGLLIDTVVPTSLWLDAWNGGQRLALGSDGQRPAWSDYDELRIWSTARTQPELQANACASLTSEPNLQSVLDFEGDLEAAGSHAWSVLTAQGVLTNY